MSDKLELKVLFTAVDNFLRPVKAITDASKTATKELKATKDALKGLENQQKLIDTWRATGKAIGITNQDLEKARLRVQQIAEAMKGADGPTAKLQRDFAQASKEARELAGAANRLVERKQRLRQEMSAAGIDTRNLANSQRDLKSKIDAATAAVKTQGAALDTQNQKMRRLKAAQAELAKTNELRGKMAGSGAAVMATGAAVGLPAAAALKTYADFETAMLGVARQVDGARDANGKLGKTYYEIGDAVKAMSQRLPLTANEIAKIVEGGARMGIQGKENLLTFAETTAVMASAFDLPVDKVGDDIGKISQLYKVPIKDIKELGDTINWLDDNALSKGGDIIDVMKRIAGTADMVKMNFREAAALGSTFLSLGAVPEVAASASNAMMRELSIATMQTKRFKGGLEMLKMDAQAIQLGMNKDATGTIIKVLEGIKALPEAKQLEAATRLFGKEYGDDAAKLASNLDEYRRQLKLVNDEKARGSMGRESTARNETLNARMSMAKNAFSNLASDLGESLKPAMVATLEKILGMIQSMRDWAKENPQLASGIMTVVKWLAVALSAIGGLTVAAAALLGPLAMIKFGMKTLGIGLGAGGSGAAAAGGLASRLLSLISPIGKVIAAFTAGYAVGSLLNGWLNSALSAFLGYETTLGASLFDLVEWIQAKFGELAAWLGGIVDRITGFFVGIWDEIKAAWDGGLTGILALIVNWNPLGVFYQAMSTVLSWFGIELPGKFSEFGANLMSGLANGILNGIQAVKDAIGGAGEAVVGYFKEKLGIHSPSRVFAELGGFTMQGLEQGLAGGEDGPLSAVSGLAKKLAGIGAGVMLGGSAIASGIPLDMRPPLSPAAMQGSGSGGNVYQITLQAPPGTDLPGLADLVAKKIEEIEAKRAVRSRSRLSDRE